jgi:FAD/FMN-containing dehydrogenase
MRGQLPRRTFLGGAVGAAASALLSGCDDGSPATPAPSSPTPPSPATPVNWQRLRTAISGQVVLPSDPTYAAAKTVFNSRYDKSAPAAVVIPASEDDVRRAMEFAMTDGVKVAPRSGGHSYVGASAADETMVIDLRRIAGAIVYDGDTTVATVRAAAGLDPLQRTLAGHGRLIPSGSCPTVGVAGLTLGGGLGADTRSAGLTCDALLSASVVLPGGELVTANPDDHPDLFWALRGGGGGNFGVTTSFSFRTYPAVDRDVVTMRYPDPAVADVIVQWSAWLAASDRATWGLINIPIGPGAAGCTVVLATPAGAGTRRAADLVAAIGTSPLSTDTRTRGRLDFVRYFEGGDGASRPRSFVAGSDIIGDLTSGAAQAIVAATKSWPAKVSGATAVIESLTGAIRDVAPDATAFPWRRDSACIQWYSEPSTPEAIEAATTWLARAHQEVAAHSVGGYVNYLEPGTAAKRYFGDNLSRLATVRSRYDPQGLMGSGLAF